MQDMKAVSFTLFQRRFNKVLLSLLKKIFNQNKGPFQLTREGRCGYIKFEENGFKKDLYWEMSGSKKFDILMSPVNLRYWDEPRGLALSEEERLHFLNKLRNYLDSIKYRSDIHLPSNLTEVNKKCIWKGCKNSGFDKLSYCQEHYDQITIGGNT